MHNIHIDIEDDRELKRKVILEAMRKNKPNCSSPLTASAGVAARAAPSHAIRRSFIALTPRG